MADSGDLDLGQTVRGFAAGQKVFRRYTLKRILGRGGMGIVWLASDEELEREVALKFLPEIIAHDRSVLKELRREAKRSLDLTHKNIVRIYDFVHNELTACISMEYIDGDTLSNLRADKPNGVFEPDELQSWLMQLCDALSYAHEHAKIVHRDLKPGNLIVNSRGELKVTDFGIARSLADSVSMLTKGAVTSGTLLYMSPQQLNGEQPSPLDDIYAVGATLYDLLTSKPPFYVGNIDKQIREKPPVKIGARRSELGVQNAGAVPEIWEQTVASCLAKNPAQRPQNAGEIASRLSLRRPIDVGKPNDATSKRSALIGFAVLLLAGVAATGWYLSRQSAASPASKPGADQRSIAAEAPKAGVPPATPQASVTSSAAPAGVGGLIVDTTPQGATVMLGGLDAAKSPATFKGIRSGTYRLRAVLDNYEPLEREVEIKSDEFTELGALPLERSRGVADITTTPAGAKVMDGASVLGATPFHQEVPAGETTLIVAADGYLPREVKMTVKRKAVASTTVALATPASAYKGEIHIKGEGNGAGTPLTIKLKPDVKSGTMTQSSRKGDTVVNFSGSWVGTTLYATTGDVVSKPEQIHWDPESFSLRFSDDGKKGSYECTAGGKTYVATLASPN